MGTTAVKAAVFDETGQVKALAREGYDLVTKGPSIIELGAETYWRAFCSVVRRVADDIGNADLITALCIGSQGETLVPVDRSGKPTRDAIVWLDNRATREAQAIADELGTSEVFRRTGQPQVLPTWPACKIGWIRNHEPEVFSTTSKFLLLEDYLVFRLTGELISDRCLQSSSLLLDINDGRWWQPMLDAIGLTAERLPELVDSGQIVGQLTKQAAAATGLRPETLVVTGGLDHPVGAIGAGNVRPGVATETTGGTLAIVATILKPEFDSRGRVPCHIHAGAGLFCLLPWGQTAGLGLKWLVDNFFGPEAFGSASGSNRYQLADESAASVPPGSEGLTVLPHFEGAACPELNPAARAVFFGITLAHNRGHFARALMEAVAYMLKANLDLLEGLAGTVSEIRSTGGGANSDLWLQIKADVIQKPIVSVETAETTCLGAAMLAAVASGSHKDIPHAAKVMVRLRKRYDPNKELGRLYLDGYARYVELYERLLPMFNGRDQP